MAAAALLLLCLAHGALGFSGGPVYVGPQGSSSPSSQAAAAVDAGLRTTQTVYGFLDFTTTIGNTVMVFSPQSAPAPTTPGPSTTTPAAVIETRPPPAAAAPAPASIQPSRPTATKQPAVLSSVVEVRGGDSPVFKPEGPVLSSKVEVREGGVSSAAVPASPSAKVILSSVVEVKEAPKFLSSIVEVKEAVSVAAPKVLSSVVQVFGGEAHTLPPPKVSVLTSSHDEPAISGNNLVIGPEYDFLSRQPSEVVDETYKVIDLRPSAKHKSPAGPRSRVNVVVSSHVAEAPSGPSGPSGPAPAPAHSGPHKPHPTGLVTKLGGTVVKEGVTTVHETSVIGTFISGKYAQVLESTSHVIPPKQKAAAAAGPGIKPTAAQARILKTAAPTAKQLRHNLDPTPAASAHEETAVLPLEALFSQPASGASHNQVRPARRSGGPSAKNEFKARLSQGRAGRLGSSREVDAADEEQDIQEQEHDDQQGPSYKNKQRQRGFSPSPRPGGASRPRPTGPGSAEQQEQQQQQPGARRYQQTPRKNSFRNSAASTGSNSIQQEPAHTRRGYKPRLHTSAVDQETHFDQTESIAAAAVGSSPSTSLYKFKLSRPNGRWQYKTTPKPRINIRRQDGDAVTPAPQSLPQQEIGTSFSTSVSSSSSSPNAVNPEQGDIEPAASSDPDAPEQDAAAEDGVEPQPAQPQQETIKVSISTPADFKDTYYEIATIRSPYTFQVGQNKNTRFITVTSTYERTLEPTTTVEAIQPTLSPSEPLTENILASTTATAYDKRLALEAATLATLPPIQLAPDQATPPLQTETETFSTTQVLLKTHILPVVRGPQNTTLYTLVQTYSVTRLVTAIKTLPPMEVYQFVPSKTLTDLNTRLDEAGSELHLELDFGDDGNGEDNDDDENPAAVMARIAPELDLANVGQEFDPFDVDRQRPKKAHHNGSPANAVQGQGPTEAPGTTPPPTTPNPALSPEQLQQLALLRFLNPQAAAALGPQVITTSKPVLKVETLYESHVIPVFNGLVTSLSTLSRPVSTVTRTEYELATSTALPPPGLPPQALPPPGFPALPFPPQANQFQVTSSPLVTQTMVTQTDSKVLKLTFGAKTAYTTLFSTRVVPTLLTTYLTANVPVQPTAAPFPGYFPSPFPSYPYVG